MHDLAKLKNARYYMLAMAEGVNPCTREFAPETDVIAIPSVQEQCEYVMCVLDELKLSRPVDTFFYKDFFLVTLPAPKGVI